MGGGGARLDTPVGEEKGNLLFSEGTEVFVRIRRALGKVESQDLD